MFIVQSSTNIHPSIDSPFTRHGRSLPKASMVDARRNIAPGTDSKVKYRYGANPGTVDTSNTQAIITNEAGN